MNIFSYLSVGFDLLGNVPYLFQVAKGTVKTHPFTWLIWTLLTFIMAIVQYNEGAGGGSWLLINTTIFNTIITTLAFRSNAARIDAKDYAVLVVCILCFPLYFYFQQPILTAIVITLVDSISFIPMIRKSFKSPHDESIAFQCFMVLAYISSLLAMEAYSISTCLFPVAMVLMHGITAVIIVVFRRKIPSIRA
jgi:hypothetical protein